MNENDIREDESAWWIRMVLNKAHDLKTLREIAEHYPMSRPPLPPARVAVYAAIDRERDYQDKKWGGPEHDRMHNSFDWHFLIRKALAKAMAACGGGANRAANLVALHEVRQVAALAVACLEHCGCPERVPLIDLLFILRKPGDPPRYFESLDVDRSTAKMTNEILKAHRFTTQEQAKEHPVNKALALEVEILLLAGPLPS